MERSNEYESDPIQDALVRYGYNLDDVAILLQNSVSMNILHACTTEEIKCMAWILQHNANQFRFLHFFLKKENTQNKKRAEKIKEYYKATLLLRLQSIGYIYQFFYNRKDILDFFEVVLRKENKVEISLAKLEAMINDTLFTEAEKNVHDTISQSEDMLTEGLAEINDNINKYWQQLYDES